MSVSSELDILAALASRQLEALARQPIETDESGVRLVEADGPYRWSNFRTNIIDSVSAGAMALAINNNMPNLTQLLSPFEDGIDVAAHFLGRGSTRIQQLAPGLPFRQKYLILADSFPTVKFMMSGDQDCIDTIERNYGLQSEVTDLTPRDELQLSLDASRLTLQQTEIVAVIGNPGRCPFGERMRPLYGQMLACAAQVEWLLPTDFQHMSARV